MVWQINKLVRRDQWVCCRPFDESLPTEELQLWAPDSSSELTPLGSVFLDPPDNGFKAFTAIRGRTLSSTRTHPPCSPFGPWQSCCQWAGSRRHNSVLEVFHVQADLMAETTPYKERSLKMRTLPGIACEEESMGVGEQRTRHLMCLFLNLKLTLTEFN